MVDELTGELVCYARSVVGVQWARMESGTLGEQVNPWGVELFQTLRTVQPQTATEQSAYDKWLDQNSAREQARIERIHGAVGVIPAPLWIVLFFSAGLIFVYMLFFADSGERAPVQALMMGTVVAVITAMLLLLTFLNNPFHAGVGGLRPEAMERTLEIIEQELEIVGAGAPPCDAAGNAQWSDAWTGSPPCLGPSDPGRPGRVEAAATIGIALEVLGGANKNRTCDLILIRDAL